MNMKSVIIHLRFFFHAFYAITLPPYVSANFRIFVKNYERIYTPLWLLTCVAAFLTDFFCCLLLNGIHDDTHDDFLNDCCDFIFTFWVKIILTDPVVLFSFLLLGHMTNGFLSWISLFLFIFFLNYFKIFFFCYKTEKKQFFFFCFLLQEYLIFGHDLIF